MLLFALVACPQPTPDTGRPSAQEESAPRLADAADAELEALVYAVGSGSANLARVLVFNADSDAADAEAYGIEPCPTRQVADDGLVIVTGGCTSVISGLRYEGEYRFRDPATAEVEGGAVEFETAGFSAHTPTGRSVGVEGTLVEQDPDSGAPGEYDVRGWVDDLPVIHSWGILDCAREGGTTVCDESTWAREVDGLGEITISPEADGSPWRIDGEADGITIVAPEAGTTYTVQFDDGTSRTFAVEHFEAYIAEVFEAMNSYDGE